MCIEGNNSEPERVDGEPKGPESTEGEVMMCRTCHHQQMSRGVASEMYLARIIVEYCIVATTVSLAERN